MRHGTGPQCRLGISQLFPGTSRARGCGARKHPLFGTPSPLRSTSIAIVVRCRAPFGPPAGFPDWPGLYPPCLGGSVSIPARGPQAIRSGLEEISDTQAAFMSPFNVVTPRSPATRSNWLRSSSSLSVRERRSSASRICCCTGPPLGPDSSTLLVSTQPDAALDRLRRPRDTICALPGLPWAMARARSSHHSKARIRPS